MAFPSTPLAVTVELALGADLTASPASWSWTDVTAYTYHRDRISIVRGRPDEASVADPAELKLTVDNRDGRWSTRNPTGAWFGQLRKGTPIRVSAEGHVRFAGFISNLPPRWDLSGRDRYAPLEAKGLLYRLAQGSTPARSAMRRSGAADNPVAYWPLEDPLDSTSGASAVTGGSPMTVTSGAVDFGVYSDLAGSGKTPDMSAGWLTGTITGASSTSWHAEFSFFGFASTPAATARIYTNGALTNVWRIFPPNTGGGALVVFIDDAAGAGPLIGLTGPAVSADFGDFWHHLAVTAEQSGTNMVSRLYLDGTLLATDTTAGTLGAPTSVVLNHNYVESFVQSYSHVLVGDGVTPSGLASAMSGYAGELAHVRFLRLCDEEGIPATCTASESQAMGPQGELDFLELLRECEASDQGFLYDDLTFGLTYQSHTQRENLSAALALNYNTPGHVADLEATDDDRDVRNDVEVKRTDGSSTRVTEESTAVELSIPNAGRRDDSKTYSLYTDAQTSQLASWRLHVGTFPGYRYPSLSLNLAAGPSLITSVCAADLAFRTTISNPPTDIGPDTVDLIVDGYHEKLGLYDWDFDANCSLNGPWRVSVLANTSSDTGEYMGRFAADEACALRATITSSATSADFDPNVFRWTSGVADDFPIDVRLGGEAVTVSAISTTAVTVVGIGTASHADNAAINPSLYGSNAATDLICLLGRIRGTAGSLATPSGYTLMKQIGNLYFWAKVHSGTESAPTVTPSGGSAGDVVSAVTFGLRGTSCTLTDLTDMIVEPSVTQNNASAGDIAYGGVYPKLVAGCIILLLAGKSDDWTSAIASGWTELGEPTTTTGNDQSMYIAYKIQTTPAVSLEGTIAVTGGASAVSESMVLALAAGYQTMTISARSVNGVVKSHAAGTRIEVEDAFVLAL